MDKENPIVAAILAYINDRNNSAEECLATLEAAVLFAEGHIDALKEELVID